ncbi:MAG: hypothetical protein GXY05_00935 [Clostridiales bacterium]|nr:hypothetical protein [Clostridiales bacterium]
MSKTKTRKKAFSELDEKTKQSFIDLASHLSPENLSCDGELSRAQVNRRYAELMNLWKDLERANGITVSEDEVWDYVCSNL